MFSHGPMSGARGPWPPGSTTDMHIQNLLWKLQIVKSLALTIISK